jgi:hypothetical protein
MGVDDFDETSEENRQTTRAVAATDESADRDPGVRDTTYNATAPVRCPERAHRKRTVVRKPRVSPAAVAVCGRSGYQIRLVMPV